MNREFLDLYNRELDLLYEQAAEFSEEYPRIAGRLGSLLKDRADPMAAGLLEGSAFLAARVQLKLKHEFPEFTNNLIEQLIPHYLAPTPSAMMVQVGPNYGDQGLREGKLVARGAALDAAYAQAGRRVACRYHLTAPINLLPFEVTSAQYFTSAGPVQALGVPAGGALAGLRLSLTHRMAPNPRDEVSDEQARKMPETWFSGCRTKELPIYFGGSDADADALYEQLTAHCEGVFFRFLDEFGNPDYVAAPKTIIEQVGFAEADCLMPNDNRIFSGFDLLREYFLFPRKFLGVSIGGLERVLPRLKVKSVDIVFTFNEVNARLAAAVKPQMFQLYAAPAINLFEMTTDRVPVRANQHEYQVIPDKSRYLDFEPHRIVSVFAHYAGGSAKAPVRPLYSAASEADGGKNPLVYTIRRLPRLTTLEEKRAGTVSNYSGIDMYLSLGEGARLDDVANVAELSVRALCSNRHLPEHLPIGAGQSDFRLVENVALTVNCVAGPTPPREPVVKQMRSRAESASTGLITWRLINMLSLNHLGLVSHGAGRNADALREVLAMFADLADSATERRLRGVKSVESRPVVRRIRQASGIGAARGIEITVTLDDKAFEGSGLFLLGAALDRFFCEYSAFNHFTQTVIRSTERGEIMRWPARVGMRRPI